MATKGRAGLVGLALCVATVVAAPGQPARAAGEKLEWRMTEVPVNDVQAANRKMKTIIDRGWTPWGLANRAGTLQAFFIRGPRMFPYDGWKISFIQTSRAALQATIQGLLEKDWLPTGFANAGPGALAVVLLHVPNLNNTLHSWRLAFCALDATWGACMNQSVTARMNEQYMPMAMSAFDGQISIFYVRSAKVDKLPFKAWKAPKSRATGRGISQNLDGAVAQGMLPMAFLIVGDDFLSLGLK